MQVEKVRPDMFESVAGLFGSFRNPLMAPADWRRMLFDYPWPCDEDHRGYVLTDGGRAVGFLGTIFSRRVIDGRSERFCNLSSWVVEPAYRNSGMQLLMPVLGMRGCTIVNLTPTGSARKIFEPFRFRVFETAQLLLAPVATPAELLRAARSRLFTRADDIRERLEGEARVRFDDHQGTLARFALVERAGRQCLAIATPHRLRGVTFAHVHYLSDPSVFWTTLPQFKRGFLRELGAPALMVDERLSVPEHRPARGTFLRKALHRPRLFRPAHGGIADRHVDSLYSELMGLRWDPKYLVNRTADAA